MPFKVWLFKTLKTKTVIATIIGLLLGGATNVVNWRHERFILTEPEPTELKRAELDRDFLLRVFGGLGTGASALAIIFRGVSKKGFQDENNDGIPDQLQRLETATRTANAKIESEISKIVSRVEAPQIVQTAPILDTPDAPAQIEKINTRLKEELNKARIPSPETITLRPRPAPKARPEQLLEPIRKEEIKQFTDLEFLNES